MEMGINETRENRFPMTIDQSCVSLFQFVEVLKAQHVRDLSILDGNSSGFRRSGIHGYDIRVKQDKV